MLSINGSTSQSNVRNKNIGSHQIEKVLKFLSFIYLKKINIEVADYRSKCIFLLECVNYGRNLFDKSFDIGIILVVVWWFVKGIKNGCPCIVEIRGTQGCALVRDPARAVGECRDVAKAQP